MATSEGAAGGPERRTSIWHDTQEAFGLGFQIAVELDFYSRIDNAHVHRLGVQIDPAVECVLTLIESHHGPPWTEDAVEPASGKTAPCGIPCEPSGIAFYTWERRLRNPEAMMSIKSLQATRDGGSNSASRFTSFDPACLSSGRLPARRRFEDSSRCSRRRPRRCLATTLR